jgi:hypothetical protein
MAFLPRPDAARTAQDVEEIYALTAEELQRASTPEERRLAFRHGLLQAYEAGVDAQREVVHTFSHDRPTPIPPPPGPPQTLSSRPLGPPEDDPGTIPPDKPHWRGPGSE